MAYVGRKILIKTAGTTIAGVVSKSMGVNIEVIDVSQDSSNGYRTLLPEAGEKSIDWSIEGVYEDGEFRQIALSSLSIVLPATTIEFGDGDTLAGTFMLSAYEETGSYKDKVTFTATIQSSGAYTFTAGV